MEDDQVTKRSVRQAVKTLDHFLFVLRGLEEGVSS